MLMKTPLLTYLEKELGIIEGLLVYTFLQVNKGRIVTVDDLVVLVWHIEIILIYQQQVGYEEVIQRISGCSG